MIDTINLRRPFTFACAERNLKLALENHDWPEEDKQPNAQPWFCYVGAEA